MVVNAYVKGFSYDLHSFFFSPHFRATDGLLASLAEDLFLQLGLTKHNCGGLSGPAQAASRMPLCAGSQLWGSTE